jgi:hypothetical protein
VQTRCPCLNFDVSNIELIAKMKELCEKGYSFGDQSLTSKDCYDVLEFMLRVIEDDPCIKRDGKGLEKKLNLRMLISGFRFLALARLERTNWKNMLHSQLKQEVGASKRSRSERLHDERKIALEIAKKKWAGQHEKLVEYCKQTGRNLEWADKSKDSKEYKSGLESAKKDFARKIK